MKPHLVYQRLWLAVPQKMSIEVLNRKEPSKSTRSDEAVALGAVAQTAILTMERAQCRILLDIVPNAVLRHIANEASALDLLPRRRRSML